jgi:transposase-like protein
MQDYITRKILWYDYVKYEKLEDYKRGIQWIENNGFTIVAIVCDGLKGLTSAFPSYPIQLCMFHQKAAIKRYLTNNPKLAPAIELKSIMSIFTAIDKESFTGLFDEWYDRWKYFINERRIDTETGKKHYVHKRLRSAYLSLKRNMPYIWIWYDYPELNLPKTNNTLESFFSHLKRNLNLHNGLSKEHKKTVINEYIRQQNLK